MAFTPFEFSVNYTDLDNNQPDYINITIDSDEFTMTKDDYLDTNFMDGCKYVYITTQFIIAQIRLVYYSENSISSPDSSMRLRTNSTSQLLLVTSGSGQTMRLTPFCIRSPKHCVQGNKVT